MKKMVSIAVVSLAMSAFSQEHVHDGFLFRVGLGVASTSASVSDNLGNSIDMETAFGINILQIGYSINPEIAIALEMSGTNTSDPEISMFGQTQKANGTVLGNGMIGPAITYSLMPQNIYFSGALGYGVGTSENSDADTKGKTDAGFGLSLTIGKEWYVSQDWSLGVALNTQRVSATDKGTCDECEYTGSSYGIYFSATFN